ncbi:MAG TPA: tryptophan 7-halogenase [Allosphingosinicella sp.]
MNAKQAIRSVCVAGGGIVGLSAALAFTRALPKAKVTVAALPADPAALADRLPSTLPMVGRFHAAIGLDEMELVRSGAATHRLATRYVNWSAGGETWHHALGGAGADVGGVPFHKAWAKARAAGRAAPYDRHIAAAMLAKADKFVHPDNREDSPLGTYLYALRLDPDLYRARLQQACDAARIERLPTALAGVERRGDGGAAALLLDSGRRIEADLFLDCAGPSAPVRSVLGDDFEDWSAWHPADRFVLGEAAHEGPSPVDVVEARPEGWRWTAPLAARTMSGFAYASSVTGVPGAASLRGAAEPVSIRPGRRRSPWAANVLAIGDAAVAVDPLAGLNLHLAQSAILRALELLPGRDCHPLELAEYHRRTEWETQRARDFIALHYLRSGRTDGPFWAALAGRAVPDMLAVTLEQWERRGRLPFFEEESVDKDGWAAVLLGLGVVPHDVDPVADGIPLGRSAEAIARHAERLAALPARLPAYADYLERMRSAPAQPPRR